MNVLGIPELANQIAAAAAETGRIVATICMLRRLCRHLRDHFRAVVAHFCKKSTVCGFKQCYYEAKVGHFSVTTTTACQHRLYAHSRPCRIDGAADCPDESVFVWERPRAYEIRLSRRDFAAIVRLFGLNAATDYAFSPAGAGSVAISDGLIVVPIITGHRCHIMTPYTSHKLTAQQRGSPWLHNLFYYNDTIYNIDWSFSANTTNVRALKLFKC